MSLLSVLAGGAQNGKEVGPGGSTFMFPETSVVDVELHVVLEEAELAAVNVVEGIFGRLPACVSL
jgi:hypothetical protein